MIRLALYEPDIPQNTGAAMRLCACLGTGLDIIEPCGFPWDERKIKTAAMDYFEAVNLTRYKSWTAFHTQNSGQRLVLMTTKGAVPYTDFEFKPDDILIAGRESAGVPDDVHDACESRIVIPMQKGLRSLNVINASAMILGESLRQTKGFSYE